MGKNTVERRFVNLDNIEIREKQDEDKMIIEGYPIVYGQRTVLFPGLVEVIESGAAADALEKKNTNVYWNHDTAKPMAGFKNETLEASEDEKGVFMRAEVQGSVWGREGYEAIKSKLVDQMSFAFSVEQDGETWVTEEGENGSVTDIRTIKKIKNLYDFSPVTEPAYETTEVYARSKEVICRNKPESEASDKGTPSGDSVQTPISVLREKLKIREVQ